MDICQAQARRVWSTVSGGNVSMWAYEDIQQEALLTGWQWERRNAVDIALGYLPNLAPFASVAVRHGVIDALRRQNPVGRGETKRYVRLHSLDEPVGQTGATLGSTLVDPLVAGDFQKVENHHDLLAAFRAYRGPARAADAAWLYAHGCPSSAVAAHFGVTEGRVCRLRQAFVGSVQNQWAETGSGAA